MVSEQRCPECGAVLENGVTCQDHFYQMGYWENEHPDFAMQVHHLMVLSYFLQHPSLYSPEGLRGAKALLVDYLEGGMTPQQTRARDRAKLDSSQRQYKIKGTASSHGSYNPPVNWT